MHQQSRHPPRVTSPATSPQTNPTRTNNPRDAPSGPSRSRAGSEAAMQQDGGSGPAEGAEGPAAPTLSKESIKKLDQIIQNFHAKAAVLILQSRMNVTPSAASRRSDGRKVNKWFQIETDDIDDFKEEMRIWKTCGGFENRPPPMIIETYIDASQLPPGKSLVILDDNGRRRDVMEVLNSSESSSDSSPSRARRRNTEIVLERWKIELKCLPNNSSEDFGPLLPTIYKRSIIFFRSLFVSTRVMPAWKFAQQSMTKAVSPPLAVRCRVLSAESEVTGYDPLRQPLLDGRDVVTDYMFGDLEVPVGRFYASVTYRNDCNFRVDDSEALLSSRFMGIDDQYFKPSLPQRTRSGRQPRSTEIGSLPNRHGRHQSEQQQTYGSLSTFHGTGPLGASPISALRAIRPPGSDTSSPPASIPTSVEPDPPNSLPISGRSSTRPSLRNVEGMARRPSVSFNPFKAGSLSGSPRISDEPSSPHSLTRQSGLSALTQARNRSSLTAGMAASLRGGPPAADPGSSSSPKPTPSRYSSSFTHRRNRPSFSGNSRQGDDDQGSSGKQSLSSSVAQPGSGLLAEPGGGSSGSFQTDDDNISEFLKALDSKKTLQSFEASKKGESATKRTAAQLSKFHLMRDSNIALTESMNSSMQLHRSSSSSSRQLTSVPGASMSASSSPSKPLSPHTPHTPAIPSRLSENSIADYQGPQANRRAVPDVVATEEEGEEAPVSQEGTNAIDIPLSPRLIQVNRRASSVANRGADDEDADVPYGGQRSLSLGADEGGEPPTLSTLLRMERESGDRAALQPAAEIRTSAQPGSLSSGDREEKQPPSGLLSSGSASYRLRYTGSPRTRSRATPPQSSRGSFVGSSTSRYPGSLTRGPGDGEADDEPLVFDMSEIGRELNRRSLEEGRGGGSTGSASADRAGYEPRGTRRTGWQNAG